MNTIGTLFRLTDFGESHGPAIGGVIDGMPAGFAIDFDGVDSELARRRPGQSAVTTQRRESDRVEWLSGIYQGRTLGTPIAFIIRNEDARSEDYANLEHMYRPNHADYTYDMKYGIRDHRGGGRASARETAVRVVAGALARQVLATTGIEISARVAAIGGVEYSDNSYEEAILEARQQNDTLGGIVQCCVKGVPAGLGEPVFGKLQAMLAAAMMSINAAKGFEYGDGFAAAAMRGSESVDEMKAVDGKVVFESNHSGGIQGGISNGRDIVFRVAFKPVASLPIHLHTIMSNGEPAILKIRGRHDVCVVPRAVPVVEAMAAITILDALLLAGK